MSASPAEYGPLIESRCPQCNYKLTGASIIYGEDQKPEAGDFSVCLNCGQILVFDADLTLRKMSADKIRELMTDKEAWDTIEQTQMFIRRRGRSV